jgi:hypothetical protein
VPGYRASVKACLKLYLSSPREVSTCGGTVPSELNSNGYCAESRSVRYVCVRWPGHGRRPPQSLGRPPAQRHADPPRQNDDGDYRGLALGRRRRRLARTLESSSTASLPHVSAPPVSGCVASRFPRPRVWAASGGRMSPPVISGGVGGADCCGCHG